MSEVNWWEDWPCPLHPSWKLDDISERDLNQHKRVVETDDPNLSVVESAIYRAFLEYPFGRPFFNQGRDNPKKALEMLATADDYVQKKFQGNDSAKIGYGIVINAFRLRISFGLAKAIHIKTVPMMRELITQAKEDRDYKFYITVVQGYIYSRLGRPWQSKALSLYISALERFPDNCEWLFRKALLLGRDTRQQGFQKGWTHEDVKNACLEEKKVLEKILEINPDFHSARAFLGQVKFTLGEEGAETDIREALEHEPERHNIVMVATKYFRRKKDFKLAGKILERFINSTSNVEADTYFQLGFLKCSQAFTRGFSVERQSSLWREALNHFNKSVEINSCHYPAITKKAEVTARLGETAKARELFEELFENIFRNKPFLAKEELTSLDCALGMNLPSNMNVFTTEQLVTLSHRYILLTTEVEKKMLEERCQKKIKKHLQKLAEIISNESESANIRRMAKLKLADCNRRLTNFKEAKELYEILLKENETDSNAGEILWGIGKCSFHLKLDREVFSIADRLTEMNQQQYANELYADVNLKSAKSKLQAQPPSGASNIFLQKPIIEDLEIAINMGSLEASYVFVNFLGNFKKDFFTLDLRIPQIFARISLICANEHKGELLHTRFNMTADDESPNSRNEIIEKLNEILKYENYSDPENPRNAKLLELEEIRLKRLEFEINLLKRGENGKWNDSCAKSLKEVIQYLREILDHVISFYKNSVLEHTSGKSIFPVKFDQNENKVNKILARKKLYRWIDEAFPGYAGKLPADVIQTLLEVQPMYDEENCWLAVLNELNDKLKHEDKRYALETFELRTEKPGSSSMWKSEELVRKSCKEVEKLVLWFLSKEKDSGGCKNTPNNQSDDDSSLSDLFNSEG